VADESRIYAPRPAGRLVWNDDGGPHNVVVDGRSMSWEELGMALEPYEGWSFRLVIEDRVHDARPDAEIVELLRGPAAGSADA